ncbi:MAG: hypothetical protein Ct9H90mP18_09910 [Gammaproteobacteria bacterium]|nr:MAG: hypothetical protein Ct9H90mP18_09910 [Gammaproteobacteria bacterium]
MLFLTQLLLHTKEKVGDKDKPVTFKQMENNLGRI